MQPWAAAIFHACRTAALVVAVAQYCTRQVAVNNVPSDFWIDFKMRTQTAVSCEFVGKGFIAVLEALTWTHCCADACLWTC